MQTYRSLHWCHYRREIRCSKLNISQMMDSPVMNWPTLLPKQADEVRCPLAPVEAKVETRLLFHLEPKPLSKLDCQISSVYWSCWSFPKAVNCLSQPRSQSPLFYLCRIKRRVNSCSVLWSSNARFDSTSMTACPRPASEPF